MKPLSTSAMLLVIVLAFGSGCTSLRSDSTTWDFWSMKRLDYPGLNSGDFSYAYAFAYPRMLELLAQQGWSLDSIVFRSEGPDGLTEKDRLRAAIITLKRKKPVGDGVPIKPNAKADPYHQEIGKSLAEMIQKEDQMLAKSQVPTARDAINVALDVFIKKPGLDARDGSRVAGLHRIGFDVVDFAKAGELIWEIQITRLGQGVTGVIWVSATTKKATVLFPTSP